VVLVAVFRDGDTIDQIHYEVRAAAARLPRTENLGDIGMIHQRERLAFGLEAGNDLPRIHSRFEDFESHLAPDGLLLLGHEDDAEAALPDLFQQLVRSDHRAGAFADSGIDDRHRSGSRKFQEVTGFFVLFQERFP
jgi:hypothetical protein